MPTLKLTLDGKVYESDIADLMKVTIRQAKAIKSNTGMTIVEWGSRMDNIGDPDILTIMMYLFRSQAGEKVDWSEMDDLPVETILRGFELVPDPEPSSDATLDALSPTSDLDSGDPLPDDSGAPAELAPAVG